MTRDLSTTKWNLPPTVRFEFKYLICFIVLIYGVRFAAARVPATTWIENAAGTLSTRNMRRTLHDSAVTKRFILDSDRGGPIASLYVSASFPRNYCNLKIIKAPPASDLVVRERFKIPAVNTPSEKFTADKQTAHGP